MAVDLEALDAALNSNTLALLGDTITYTPAAGALAEPTFKAIVDYGDQIDDLGGTRAVVNDCAVEVPVATIAEPDGADIIDLPRRPGERFQPKDWKLDESGMNWLIVLKTKPA
jgi:hypothetical protein